MSPITAILKSVSIPASDLALVADVNSRLVALGEIDRRCRPDPHQWNQFGWLHHEVERLANELAESPSQAAAEAVHQATTRLHTANLSIGPIADCLRVAGDRIRGELTGVIARIFDAAAEKLTGEISARRAELAKGSVTMFDVQAELAAFDNRGVQLHAQLATEREAAAANPVQFLVGHIEPEVAPAPAPAPAPPPKNFRGKVKFTEPEPEPPADVLTELADEDDDDNADPFDLLAGGN